MRGGIPIQGDHPRGSMLFRRPGKEPLSGGHITPFAQEKVDGSTLPIDGAIEVDPLATNLNISLVYAPGIADRPRITAPALLKFRDIPLHPPQNGRMGQGDAALGHHLDEIAGAELKRQIPPHAQDDDFLVKVPPFEEILCRGRFRHPSRYRQTPRVSTVCTRTLRDTPGSLPGDNVVLLGSDSIDVAPNTAQIEFFSVQLDLARHNQVVLHVSVTEVPAVCGACHAHAVAVPV